MIALVPTLTWQIQVIFKFPTLNNNYVLLESVHAIVKFMARINSM